MEPPSYSLATRLPVAPAATAKPYSMRSGDQLSALAGSLSRELYQER